MRLNIKDDTSVHTLDEEEEDINEDSERRSSKSKSNLGISMNSKGIHKDKENNGF